MDRRDAIQRDEGLHRLLYEYYEAQIRFGFYRRGDSLPPISAICAAFRLGRTTVRSALAMLEAEGLVETGARRPARVVFQADAAQVAETAARYFAPRKAGILDLLAAERLLAAPFWEATLRRLNPGEQERLRRSLRAAPAAEVFAGILRFWDNRLLLNLFLEGVRYLRYPYFAERENPVLPAAPPGPWAAASAAPGDGEGVRGLLAFAEQAARAHRLVPAEPIPFRWNIYRQRPQMRYTLASLLIREILYGTYPKGSYLPSLLQMERRYGVTLATLRRTLALLEELGLVRSYQGKGTQVRMEPTPVDPSRPELREGLRLYRESLQLLALTIRSVVLATLEGAPAARRAALGAELARARERRRSCLCFEILLRFIRRECPLAAVRECYGRLAELVAWGYPFALLRFGEAGLDGAYAEAAQRMEEHLRQGDLAAFSGDWEALLAEEEAQVRTLVGRLETRRASG